MEKNLVLGKGLYPLPLAAKLVRVNYASVWRWIKSFEESKQHQHNKPLIWEPNVITIENTRYITFNDILELRIIKIFRKYNIKFKVLAALSSLLSKYLETNSPLINARFSTDGKNIYIKNDLFSNITNIYSKQILLPEIEKEIIRLEQKKGNIQSFITEYKEVVDQEIKFNSNHTPEEWCINPQKYPKICMTPDVNAGHPTISNIPTSILFQKYNAVGSTKEVSCFYMISHDDVLQAINFEKEYIH